MAIVEAVDVSKLYSRRSGFFPGLRGTVEAVRGVSCSLSAGESLGLVGESGCGKTTLAKLLVGLIRPSRGEVLIHGQRIDRLRGAGLLAARRAVQFIFQDPMNSLNPRQRLEEILSEPLEIHHLASKDAKRRRVEELLETVQLPAGYRRRFPRELSGGERQRVGIARALAVEPEALICDEPIASLDISIGTQILALLRSLCRERKTALLFISHDLRAVASLCERISVMREGRLLETAPTAALLSRPGHPYTELLIRSAQLDLDTTE